MSANDELNAMLERSRLRMLKTLSGILPAKPKPKPVNTGGSIAVSFTGVPDVPQEPGTILPLRNYDPRLRQ